MCTDWHCCEETTDRKIVLSEKKSKFVLENMHQKCVAKIAIDDCSEYDIEGPRCDYALQTSTFTVLIELKGNDLHKAEKQLKNSLKFFNEQLRPKRYAFAVTSRTPADSTEVQKMKKNFHTRFGTAFEVQSRQMTKKYEEL
jgi:hypothetical protein